MLARNVRRATLSSSGPVGFVTQRIARTLYGGEDGVLTPIWR